RRGARIGLIARDRERLDSVKKEVEEQGGRALPLSVDVANGDDVEKAADSVEYELGPIDIWVNNAMTTIFAPFTDITPDEFKRATEVTYLGFVYGTMAALKRMLPRDRGTIVQIGSALAYRSIPLQSPYCGAKHAIVGFTDSIRCELIHNRSHVHITVVHLPAMNTPQFSWCRTRLRRHPQPVPPIFTPEVAARAVYYAAHHRRREIFVGGPTVKAIYGQDILPGVADRYLGRHGYDSQQTSEPVSDSRPDNLFEPVPGPYAAHGIFTEQAKDCSLQSWFDLNRKPLGIAAMSVAGAVVLLWKKPRLWPSLR
ncbi:MAG: SDR family oxidoreductase, partial [Acidobacteriaceae bacterium]|nr:SDR family oxidoreductase [Acidobacteriaceae bacterium]